MLSEEPGTESQLGIFHQGGVQDLSTAVFSWQRGSKICGDHLDTEGRSTEERREGYGILGKLGKPGSC